MPLIDVHAHFLPPQYREALETAEIDQPDGFPLVPMWSADDHVAVMDRLGIDAAVLSVSSPGVQFGDGAKASDAVSLAQCVNDAAASAIADHPGRFGAFASLPMADTDASLAEIERSLDGLGLDGVNVLTNVGGVYLGDASLEPTMAELHRRRALVFIHPTSPACWECTSLGYPRPMIEFPFDTTRAVTNMLMSGVFTRYPDIRKIVPHAGGTLPFLAAADRRHQRTAGCRRSCCCRCPAGAAVLRPRGQRIRCRREFVADVGRPPSGALWQRLAIHARTDRRNCSRLDHGRRQHGEPRRTERQRSCAVSATRAGA